MHSMNIKVTTGNVALQCSTL